MQPMGHSQSQGGFTVIELLVVVIIMAILGAIALPSFLGQADRAKAAEVELFLSTWLREQQAKYVEHGDFSSDDTGTIDAAPKNYSVSVNTFSNHKNLAGENVSGLRIRAVPTEPNLKQFMGKVWYDSTENDVETVLCSSEGTTAFMGGNTYCPN